MSDGRGAICIARIVRTTIEAGANDHVLRPGDTVAIAVGRLAVVRGPSTARM